VQLQSMTVIATDPKRPTVLNWLPKLRTGRIACFLLCI